MGIYGCWYDLPFGSLICANQSAFTAQREWHGELTVTSDMTACSICIEIGRFGLEIIRKDVRLEMKVRRGESACERHSYI